MKRVQIIAEAGVNHNGDFSMAQRMIEAAAYCGADYIKFQTFKSERAVSRFAPKAVYQQKSGPKEESQFEMVKRLELSYIQFEKLHMYCRTCGVAFLSTPFDLESIAFLDKLGLDVWKVPSGEVTNLPYLLAIARTKKPIILSTGMCTMEEVERCVGILRENGTTDITLLHCTTEYPAPYAEVNLRAIDALRVKFGCPIGYSDHTPGIEVSIAAAAMGACVIEKHFTLDRSLPGPDHKASLEPDELARMVRAIRNVEMAMGNGDKVPTPSEQKNIAVARKSIVALRAIQKGEILSEENITTKRPGTGLSPMRWFEVLGTKATRDFAEDEMITL